MSADKIEFVHQNSTTYLYRYYVHCTFHEECPFFIGIHLHNYKLDLDLLQFSFCLCLLNDAGWQAVAAAGLVV